MWVSVWRPAFGHLPLLEISTWCESGGSGLGPLRTSEARLGVSPAHGGWPAGVATQDSESGARDPYKWFIYLLTLFIFGCAGS